MKTDWALIRAVINTAIDSCEALEDVGYSETDREKVIDVGGRSISVQDFLVSGWTIAEDVRYQVIRERHERGEDRRYIPETSRILVAVTEACAELVSGGQDPAGGDAARRMAEWFREHFDPNIKSAIKVSDQSA
ncbi:hypothetical protein F3J17_04585 [Burkholderia sp. Ax-1719]|nr:hypothetical protein [Burkholderia sp. Ax-1719]